MVNEPSVFEPSKVYSIKFELKISAASYDADLLVWWHWEEYIIDIFEEDEDSFELVG